MHPEGAGSSCITRQMVIGRVPGVVDKTPAFPRAFRTAPDQAKTDRSAHLPPPDHRVCSRHIMLVFHQHKMTADQSADVLHAFGNAKVEHFGKVRNHPFLHKKMFAGFKSRWVIPWLCGDFQRSHRLRKYAKRNLRQKRPCPRKELRKILRIAVPSPDKGLCCWVTFQSITCTTLDIQECQNLGFGGTNIFRRSVDAGAPVPRTLRGAGDPLSYRHSHSALSEQADPLRIIITPQRSLRPV